MKTFKIVKIIDNMSVIINGGTIHGIKEDDTFRIYTQSDVVIDPETNEVLGSFETTKATLKAFYVYEKMTICKNAFYDSPYENPLNVAISSMLVERKPLNVDKKQITPLIRDNTIRIGDVVVLLDLEKQTNDEEDED